MPSLARVAFNTATYELGRGLLLPFAAGFSTLLLELLAKQRVWHAAVSVTCATAATVAVPHSLHTVPADLAALVSSYAVFCSLSFGQQHIVQESGENCTTYLCTPSLFFGYQDCQGEKGVQFSLWRENPDENPDFRIFLGVQCVRKSGFTDCTPKFSLGVQSVSCLGVQCVIRGYNV